MGHLISLHPTPYTLHPTPYTLQRIVGERVCSCRPLDSGGCQRNADGMPVIYPPRLQPGDEIRVLGLSRSLGGILAYAPFTEADVAFAQARLEALQLKVSYGRHVWECNEHLLASPAQRLADLHEALSDPAVKAILAVAGGVGAIQILDGIDYALAGAHPKIFCGYSDNAYVFNALLAKAGLVTYYGPNFSSLMMRRGADTMLSGLQTMLFDAATQVLTPAERWSDDNCVKEQEQRTFYTNEGYWAIQPGRASGTIIGGNTLALNFLQGSRYCPAFEETILFLESPGEGKASLIALDKGLRALTYQPGFDGVRGIVIGHYPTSAGVTCEKLRALLAAIPALRELPIAAHVDFGHTTSVTPIPLGGWCDLVVEEGAVRITLPAQLG